MKMPKILATAAFITSLTTSIALAAPQITVPNTAVQQRQSDTAVKDEKQCGKKEHKGTREKVDCQQDPVKSLESKKERIQSKLKEGKITKEKADEITVRIEARIKTIQEFNKLTLQQKKNKLTDNVKMSMDRKVREGKLPQDKANELLKEYTDKISQWDGSGYPKFVKKALEGREHKKTDEK